MELSTAMRYVMIRAQSEAAALFHINMFPEHILLGIMKLSELSAEEISPTSSHKADIDEDIGRLKEIFTRRLKLNPSQTRVKLRQILAGEIPGGNGSWLISELLDKATEAESRDQLYPSVILKVIIDNPSPIIKSVLGLKDTENSAELSEVNPKTGEANREIDEASSGEQLSGVAFLPVLTRRIRDMRYGLLNKVQGQDHGVHAFAEGLFASEVLSRADENRKRPRAIFVFAGPPGVGKTFLAEQAAEALELPFKRFDMSSYSDHQAHIQLIGFAASYKDAKEGLLTGFVKKNPNSILLFDEIEKANLNTIQLFLQILDAGNLHDDFLDQDISFKDTIIIFTTNGGRQLYEGEYLSVNAANLPRQTILNALETDVHPQTGKPFFPAAICSRLATGYPIMFNHLSAHNLESISQAELQRLSGLFEKQYGIAVTFDRLLPFTLLFAEGGLVDARTLRAQSELFFKNEIYNLCRLWADGLETALEKVKRIDFTVDTGNLPDNVKSLFENPDSPEILIFNDPLFAARLSETAAGLTIYSASELVEAFEILSKQDVGFVVMKLCNTSDPNFDPMATRYSLDEPIFDAGTVGAFDNVPMAASSLAQSRGFFKALRERMPEMPVYLLQNDSFIIDSELEIGFIRAGSRGKLTAASDDLALFSEDLTRIAGQIHLQKLAAEMASSHKILSFETAPALSADKTVATIRLRELSLRLAANASDRSVVLDEVEKPKVSFSDVIGAQGAKDELRFFTDYLKNPKAFAAKGLKPPKGVLLYGPPGTGKTLLARAMAGESDVAFIPAVASSFVTKWQGSGPESVRELFRRARRYAPAIIFIDEIDAIGRMRGQNTGHGEEMALNALLTEMDGFSVDPKRPVFVLGATNFEVESDKSGIGVIDQALVRRFDRRILVDLPTKQDRMQYIRYMLNKRPGHMVSEVMIERLAGSSAGLSLANLESVMELAARNAAKMGLNINDEILEEAFELTRHGEKKDWGLDYLERVARHEAGHAYLCFLGGKTPSYLTIVARGNHGGYMEHVDTETPLQTKEALLSRIRTALGGRAAEVVYYGQSDGISTGASGDLESATRLATAMLVAYGMEKGFGLGVLTREQAENGPLAPEIRDRVNGILDEQMTQALSMIEAGKSKIDRLVSALLEKNRLNRKEMEALLTE